VALTTLTTAAAAIASPVIHEAGFAVAMVLGAVALALGAYRHGLLLPVAVGSLGLGVMAGALSLPHGASETAYTLFGVLILAFGHHLNGRAVCPV
jgi:MerC mercury resistance protein